VRSTNDPEVTTIDAAGAGSVVTCAGGEGPDTVLEGFTITGGAAIYGGGMYIDGSSPTVTDCTFSGNSAANHGGGMFNLSSSPTVTNGTFSGNSAQLDGGGMYNSHSSPTVTHCSFSGNSAGDYGGGMFNYAYSSPTVTSCTFSGNSAANHGGGMGNHTQSSPTVTNGTFSGNSAQLDGGGMYNNSNSSPTVTHCSFSGNSGGYYGGGMFNYANSSPAVTNCTFSGNSALLYGGAMANYSSSPTVTNCILWGDTAPSDPEIAGGGATTVAYSDVQGWPTPGVDGIIDADPLFVDADGADDIYGTEDDDLRLLHGSPCIDAGDGTVVTEAGDLDGNPRIMDGDGDDVAVVDMGAYEYAPDCDENGILDFCDIDCDAFDGACNVPGCGTSNDCNGNKVPDHCEIPVTSGGLCLVDCDPDCNANGIPDACDISGGSSLDANANGVPDECEYLVPEPLVGTGEEARTNRYLRFVVPVPAVAGVREEVIRMRRMSLDGLKADGTGVLYVAPPMAAPEEDSAHPGLTFTAAPLWCDPYVHGWSAEGIVSAYGAELMPGSVYEVQRAGADCADLLTNEACWSEPLVITTAKFGDIWPLFDEPGGPTQPDFSDIAAMVRKFQSGSEAPIKAVAQLQPNCVFPERPIDFKDIAADVQAFVGTPYASTCHGPCPCPPTVTCGATECTSDAGCVGFGDGMCINGSCMDPCGRCQP